MATPIVVKPQEQSPIVVSGGNSSTPLKVTQKEPSKITIKDDEDATHIVVDNNGVDYKRVERIVDDKIINKLNLKADKSDTYTKSEVDALVAEGGGGSADLSNYYTKDETDANIEEVASVTAKAVYDIKESVGLDEELQVAFGGTNYLDECDSVTSAVKKLDEVVKENESSGGGFVIPEDTYTREIDGEIYYALSGISGKELYLNIDYYDVVEHCCNGFAFQTESDFVEFTLSNDDGSDIYGSITMELEQNCERYLISSSSDYGFTKSAKRKFHTLYWDSEMLKFDLKKIHHTESFEQNYSTCVHISSNDDVKIINYGVHCAPLYVKYGIHSSLVLCAINQYDEVYAISIINPTKYKLHFSNHEQRALPKHENVIVTNNSIKATYYPNPVYFVRTDKINSCFDFIDFDDHIIRSLASIFGEISEVTGRDYKWHKTSGRGDCRFCSVRIHGDMTDNSASISVEEPNTPILKKNYTYNNRLIYTGIYNGSVIGANSYEVRLYRYRRNSNKYKNGRPVKYRKLDNEDRISSSVFGDYDVFKMSKTGVKSSISTKIRISITDGLKEKKIGGS
jgi:hypothetical protein